MAIYDLQAPIVETKSIQFYVDIIKDYATKRRIKSICSAAEATLIDESKSATEILAELASDFDNIDTSENIVEDISISELMASDVDEAKWFVDNLIPDGLTVLAGPAKIGKSFFAWNIAIAVAMGGIALSSIPIQTPRNATYFAFEDPRSLLIDRIKLMTSEMPSNLKLVSHLKNRKLDNAGLCILENYVDTTQSEMIILDTWQHVCPEGSGSGSSYDVDYQAMMPVQKFAHAKKLAIILVTHTRKASDVDNVFNQIQGSMGVQAGCDTMLMLTRNNDAASLHVTGRRIMETEYALTLSNGIWQLQGNADEYQKTRARQQIIDILHDAGDEGMRAKDIADLINKNEQTVNSMLRRMKNDGNIQQPEKRGPYFYMNGNGLPPL